MQLLHPHMRKKLRPPIKIRHASEKERQYLSIKKGDLFYCGEKSMKKY